MAVSPMNEEIEETTTEDLPGFEVHFARRKYGTTTFTWATVEFEGAPEKQVRFDPWPAVIYPQSELVKLVKYGYQHIYGAALSTNFVQDKLKNKQ